MSLKQHLEANIAALESQREALGDEIVDAALAPLRAKLESLGAAPGSEKKQKLRLVSMLFVDAVDSTAMGQQLDPEDLHAIIDGALARFADVVAATRGRVMSYTGDGLLAAFGADRSREEDPENAIHAGLAVLAEAGRHAQEVAHDHPGAAFDVRVGVHTGLVLLGGGVSAENSIRGDAVNIAARLQQAAPPGGLRISHDCYRHVRGVFDVVEEPPIRLKGVADPVRTYLVLRAKPRAFRVAMRGIEGVETPMVGRDAELGALKAAFLSLFEDGPEQSPRSITIVGDPGLGKSRLLYEFENWAEARPERFLLFKGRAHPTTRKQPFGLLRDVFAWRMQIADNDEAETARGKLSAQLAPVFGEGGEADIHALGHLIGLDYAHSPHLRGMIGDPKQIRSRGFHAAAQAFSRLSAAREAPSVLLLDDLHWADDGSLDFFQDLIGRDGVSPLLVIGFARPELDERRPGWPSSPERDERLVLGALDAQSSRAFADVLLQRLDDAPPDLIELLTSGGDGNPFFMEELVKMLIDDGVIATRPERWRVSVDKLSGAKVPSTLTGVLQARLDGLTPAERGALQAASVLGFVFWNKALQALAPAWVKALPSLVQRELIIAQRGGAIEGAKEFTFKHHVLHQVVYDSLLKPQKRDLHARAGAWFEQIGADRGGEYSGATAMHYEQAGMDAEAVRCYCQAAEAALARDAMDAVKDYVARALALSRPDDHETRWRLLAARETALAFDDDRLGHVADLEALELAAIAMGDQGLRAEAALRRARALINSGDFDLVEAAAQQAAAFAAAAGADRVSIQAKAVLATAFRRMSDYPRARALAEEGLALARASEDAALLADLYQSLAAVCAESGEAGEDHIYRKQALALYRQIGDRGNESQMLNSLGDGLLRIGDYAAARQAFDEALDIARRIGRRDTESVVMLNLAAILHLQGEHAPARALARQARDIAATIGARDLEAAACLPLGLSELSLGEFDAARASLERSRDLFLQNSGPHYALEPIAALALTALREGDVKKALRLIAPCLKHLDQGGSFQGAEEPMRIQHMCYCVLDAAGDARARAALESAHASLHARARQIKDPARRSQFLRQVPHHAAIETAWDALGASAPD